MPRRLEREQTHENAACHAAATGAQDARRPFVPWLILGLHVLFWFAVYSLFFCRCLNDDVVLAQFVNGGFAGTDLHIPFNNTLYAAMIRALYRLLGTEISWYVLFQYAALCLSYTALCSEFIERDGSARGILIDVLLTVAFLFNSILDTSFTLTAGVTACAGFFLLLRAAEDLAAGGFTKRLIGRLILGAFLSAVGFLLRWTMALPCFVLTAVSSLPFLLSRIGSKKGRVELLRFFVPVVMLALLLGGCYLVDRQAWREDGYAEWERFNTSRAKIMDYYDDETRAKLSREKESAGGEADMLELAISDPEVYTADSLAQIALSLKAIKGSAGYGQSVGILVRHVGGALMHTPYFMALVFLLAAWCLAPKTREEWLTGALWLAAFLLMYLRLIRQGRYGLQRVDLGLALSGFLVFAQSLAGKRPRREKVIAALLCVGVLLSLHLDHPGVRLHSSVAINGSEAAKKLEERCELMCADEAHVYLDAQMLFFSAQFYPLEGVAPGTYEKIIPLLGWGAQHPIQRAALEKHGLDNPFRDSVGREDVCWICEGGDIERVLSYIQKHYSPAAYVQPEEAMSEKTGLKIYYIKDGDSHD